MKNNPLIFLYIGCLYLPFSAYSATSIYEDFSSSLSMEKFSGLENSIQLDTTNQLVQMRTSARAFSRKGGSVWFQPADQSVTQMQADMAITDLEIGNAATQFTAMRLCGTFYNADSASPTDQTGDVFACISLGDRGNGPQAWWSIQESLDSQFATANYQSGDLGSIQMDTVYSVQLAYDGDNTFSFTFNNGTTVSQDGPARTAAAYANFRGIGSRLNFGLDTTELGNNVTVDYTVDRPDDGSTASIAGTLDNYTTENGLVDDFSGTLLDQTKWNQYSNSAAISNGALELKATGIGTRVQKAIYLRSNRVNSFGADVTLLSTSTINDTTRIHGRISKYLANDTYDVENGDTADGYTGTIWTQFLVERNLGANRVAIYAERASDAAWTTGQELFWTVLDSQAQLDQAYNLLIEQSGTEVIYKLDGTEVYRFDMAADYSTILSGNVYNVADEPENRNGLSARAQDDAGEVHVRFDNVVTDHVAQQATLLADNSQGEQVSLPGQIIVNETEEVTLTASVTDPSAIATYIWEQTAGPDVTIVTAPKPGYAQKIVGSDQSITFTVPSGADLQTLSFKVTIVASSGVESSQSFDLNVDNGQASTLPDLTSTTNPTTSTGGSSGGGGSEGPWMLLMLCVMQLTRMLSSAKRNFT